MKKDEEIGIARTKGGIRCIGARSWAEGETEEQARARFNSLQAREQLLAQNLQAVQSLMRQPLAA